MDKSVLGLWGDYLFEAIKFSEKESSWLNNYFYKTPESEVPVRVLSNISKINIFVGSNNCGKSRFLRNVFLNNNYQANNERELIKDINYEEISESFKDIYDSFLRKFSGINSIISIFKPYKNSSDSIMIKKFIHDIFTKYYDKQDENIKSFVNFFESNILTKQSQIFVGDNCEVKNIYIPILRGMKPLLIRDSNGNQISQKIDYSWVVDNKFKFEQAELFSSRVKKDYFNQLGEVQSRCEIFTGLSIYDDLVKSLLGELKERELVREYEKFLSDELFNNKPVVLIPRIDKDVIYVKIGNEAERPIHELGDGIQSLIILTFKMFMNKDKEMLLFIEEPEMLLHPEMQRKLLSIFKDKRFEKHQFFLTTHSNHLLDMTADFDDISVYLFRKKEKEEDVYEPDFIIENVSPDEVEILNELGVKNSSVFLSNCTIWVEGITDRLYLREYMKVYQKFYKDKANYKEDVHYSFVEYSGNNITHWSFLDDEYSDCPNINYQKITNKVLVIADKDSEDEVSKKDNRFKKLQEKLGESFCLLDCVEVENLLHENIVKKVILEYESKHNKNQGQVGIDNISFQNPNFKYNDYKNSHLGKFIDNQLGDRRKRSATYSGNISGTISDKLGFARRACSYMDEVLDKMDNFEEDKIYEILSISAKELMDRIFEFIEENNK